MTLLRLSQMAAMLLLCLPIGCSDDQGAGLAGNSAAGGAGGASAGGSSGIGGSPPGGGSGGGLGAGAGGAGEGGSGAGGSQSAHPNEPAGFIAFAEHDLSAIPKESNGLLGDWYTFPLGGGANLTVESDASAPESAPGIVRTRYPTGHPAGTGPVNFGGWDIGGTSQMKSKIYFSSWVRIVGTDYENQKVGTKVGFFGYAAPLNGAQNNGFFFLQGDGQTSIHSSFKLQFNQQNNVARNLTQNVATDPLMTVGPWHHWEAVLELNDLGAANGIFRMWIDGTLILDYADVSYITPGEISGFHLYKWNPTWGGTGGEKTRDDFIDHDHIYISGVPL